MRALRTKQCKMRLLRLDARRHNLSILYRILTGQSARSRERASHGRTGNSTDGRCGVDGAGRWTYPLL